MSDECTDACIGVLCRHWPFDLTKQIAYHDSNIKACRERLDKDPSDTFARQAMWNHELKRANLIDKLDKFESAKTKELK